MADRSRLRNGSTMTTSDLTRQIAADPNVAPEFKEAIDQKAAPSIPESDMQQLQRSVRLVMPLNKEEFLDCLIFAYWTGAKRGANEAFDAVKAKFGKPAGGAK